MKTSRTLSFTAAAVITALQLGALAAFFSVAPVTAGPAYEQYQSEQSQSYLAPILVVASQRD
jgi:hypothetical protein